MRERSQRKQLDMKRYGYLFEKVWDIDNCREAIIEASQGKKSKNRRVRKILKKLDQYTAELSEMIRTESWEPSPYTVRYINDGIKNKRRKLAKPRFWPDQCIHHAFDRVVGKIFLKSQYYYCTGSVKGKGGALSKRGLELFIKRHPELAKWVDKMDVRHCYDSVNHAELKKVAREHIKDPAILRAYDKIIDSYPRLAENPRGEKKEDPDTGLPIGIDPSRWLLNLFLQKVDHVIKRFLGKRYFMTRYADDIVIIGPNKRMIRKAHDLIDRMLTELKLKMKRDWQIFQLRHRAIDFLGFKFFKDHTEIRKSIVLRILRKIRKIRKHKIISLKDAQGMLSYKGYLKHSNSVYFRKKHMHNKISFRKLGKVVSLHDRALQRETCRVAA